MLLMTFSAFILRGLRAGRLPSRTASSPLPLMVFLLSGAVMAVLSGFASGAETVGEKLTFEQHVRPILKTYCLDCHGGGDQPEGKLDLRLKRFAIKGGETGAALVAGEPAQSLIIKRLLSGEMPPTEKKVPRAQIAVIEKWIAQGAPTLRNEPETLEPGLGITEEERAYWFYQPLRRPAIPVTKELPRARSPLDSLLQAKLEANDLSFADEAARITLIKRATFDLLGLPPEPGDVDAFVADDSPDAFERLLDRLLASPHYGERWGRHWLDVAGYADSEGDGNVDTDRPYIYKYRDFVIRSLNADKPLDQFVIEQLAGDELVPPPHANLPPESLERLIATGYLRMAMDPTASGQGDPDVSRNQVVADTLKIVSTGLMGLSVGCAQCHDHRYDPISQIDYYRMRALFEPGLNPKAWIIPRERVISLYTDEDRAKSAAIEVAAAAMQTEVNAKRQKFIDAAFDVELEKHPAEAREALRMAFKTPGDKQTPEQKKLVADHPSLNINGGVLYQYNAAAAEELKKDDTAIAAKRSEKPIEDFISVLREPGGEPPATALFHRGDHRSPTKMVTPADLTIAAPDGQRFEIAPRDPNMASSGRRLAWARHLTSGRHPLFGRVMANRIWLHHFGRGIVETPGEFGLLGTRPSYPEVLDWLALELAEGLSSDVTRPGAMSLKRLHRLVMATSAYRQSSRRRPASRERDADGSLYSRYGVRRLEAESVRDRMLTASGVLDDALFGKPIPVMEDFAGQVHVAGESTRRTVYVQVKRSKPVSLLTTFDAPIMTVNCERRSDSTVAPQSLMLMNGDFVLKEADRLAKRLKTESIDPRDRAVVEPLITRYAGHAGAWQYGHGLIEGNAVRFTKLHHYTGSSWQGGPTLPDPTTGWVIHHAAGGHAGNDQEHTTIRRWTAPQTGTISIKGTLQHPSENGDGVRGRIFSSRSGLAGEWVAKTNQSSTEIASIPVQSGDTIDFLVDCRENVNSDSFQWTIKIDLKPETRSDGAAGAESASVETWDSAADFRGPQGASLVEQVAVAWRLCYGRPASTKELELAGRFLIEQARTIAANDPKADAEHQSLTSLCQQLLSSNEFLYVD